jgi:hypothetical protein
MFRALGYYRVFSATLTLALLACTALGQAQDAPSDDPVSEVAGIRAENAALREELRRVEEQQKTLLKLVSELQQRLNPPRTVVAALPNSAPQQQSPAAPQVLAPSKRTSQDNIEDQPGTTYDEGTTGILLAKSSDTSEIPFRLNLWDTTQFRFTNNQLGNTTFTDHLGSTHDVVVRNDFSLNRNLFHFTGYIFDPKLVFNLITWTSNTTATVVIGGYVRWRFTEAFRVSGGYWGAPGSRTLAGTFPYFATIDRSMADNFFRPSFTQGVWIDGEPGKFYYMVFVGNGLNTLSIPLSKIDTGLVTSGTVAWEPLGQYGPSGRANGMYDDYENHKNPVIRIGTSFTRSRENRFANNQESNPENNALFNSDGVNTFATGALAPNVTLTDATYRMWAVDAGVKWRGLAFNSQGFARRLDSFVADGPLPLSSTFDTGAEMMLNYYLIPKKFELYFRGSFVFGQFRDSNEYGPGIRFYPVKSYRVWLAGEGLRINRCPIGSTISSYSAGFSGWEPLAQLMFTF